jgi:hypothetical protein
VERIEGRKVVLIDGSRTAKGELRSLGSGGLLVSIAWLLARKRIIVPRGTAPARNAGAGDLTLRAMEDFLKECFGRVAGDPPWLVRDRRPLTVHQIGAALNRGHRGQCERLHA